MEAILAAAAGLALAGLAFLAGRALQGQAEARRQVAALEARREALEAALAAERARADRQREEAATLQQERTRLESALAAERQLAEGRAADSLRAREQLRAEVELLGQRLLEERGKALLDRSKEGLEALLAPLGERLQAFAAQVGRTHETDLRDRATLLAELGRLQAAQARLHADAQNLTRALSGQSKVQGDWGELVLEKVLEAAGLTEGREYDLQRSHAAEEGGQRRPDALVYLPANRAIVVDAKCSLVAFLQATAADGEEARAAALDAHAASLRAHVTGLARKKYQDVLQERTLDVVFLFVPSEAAFQAALAHDAALHTDAFRQGVVLCSPSTLIAALQLVAHVWRSERQGQNAQRIAEEAGALLEKFQGFVADVAAIGARLEQAHDAYQAARNKLHAGNGNLVRRAGKLAALGARVKDPRVKALLLAAGEDDAAGGGEAADGPPGALP